VHSEAPCMAECPACGQLLCFSCRDPFEHDCIGSAGQSSGEIPDSGSDKASSDSSVALDEVAGVTSQSRASSGHNFETPEAGLLSIRWKTLHRLNATGGMRAGTTACGFKVSHASHVVLNQPDLSQHSLCGREGCFS
jgi:hypothetical protein